MPNPNTLLIKDGFVIDGTMKSQKKMDVYIEGNCIKEIAPSIPIDTAESILTVPGKVVCPGFIDLSAHIFDQLQDIEKSLRYGSKYALKGGYTTVCAMSNTNPPLDNEGMIGLIRLLSKRQGSVKVIPAACATKGLQGESLAEIDTLISAGAGLIYDSGKTISNALLVRRLMEYSKMFREPLFLHCEENSLALDGCVHEGTQATILGLPGIPSVAEEIIVHRDLLLAQYTGATIHISHVSTKGSVKSIAEAKKNGISVSASVSAHHLDLIDSDMKTYDGSYKVKPPLREAEDRDALIQGIHDGTIDCIITDHASEAYSDTDSEFANAPFGNLSLETAFQVSFERLIKKNNFPLWKLINALSTAPAEILGINAGKILPGYSADVTIIDPDAEVSDEALPNDDDVGYNSPYRGASFSSRIEMCIVDGQVCYQRDSPKEPGF